jgi:hypothetical protein
MKNLIQNVFDRFFNKKPKLDTYDFEKGFTQEQKREIVNSAITTSCQVLLTAVVMANLDEFISGDVILPDGSSWVLEFRKKPKP